MSYQTVHQKTRDDVYHSDTKQACTTRAMNLSKQFPNEVFFVEVQSRGFTMESVKQRNISQREYWLNGVVYSGLQMMPLLPYSTTSVLNMVKTSQGYPRWQRLWRFESGSSVFEAVNKAKKAAASDSAYMIAIKDVDGKVTVRYFINRKEASLEDIQALKKLLTERADVLNASWYPGVTYSLPTMSQFDKYYVKGITAKDFWAKQRLILRDIDIHLAYAQLSEADEYQLKGYRHAISTFVEALDK